MTDESQSEKQGDGLEEHLREMLSRANIPFLTSPGARSGEPDPEPERKADALKAVREFRLKPRDIRDYLNRFVIRQDEAKKVLSVAICDHFNHVRRCLEDPSYSEREHVKHNVLLLGPTGVGKTYVMRCVAKLIGVPFVKADATKFSETGYVGHDVEDLVRDLVKAADGDADLAQYGIIYLDEIDKIASQPSTAGKDVSGRGVQINLLKLMEETEVSPFSQTDLLGQMQAMMDLQRGKAQSRRTINTRHILFIVSGAFDKLPDQVRRRVAASAIGFGAGLRGAESEADFLRLAQTKDFIDYGFEPEFIGRLPVRVTFDPLDAGDLEAIMNSSEGSILAQYRADFEGYGIEFRMKPEAVRAVAERANEEQTGARGLMTVMERILRNFKFELPSTGIRSFEIDGAAVAHAGDALTELLRKNESLQRVALREEVARFCEEFRAACGLNLSFDGEASGLIVDTCLQERKSVNAFCRERFHDLEYGLKLISRGTGQTDFRLSRDLVESPASELSRMISESFRASDSEGATAADNRRKSTEKAE